MPSLDSSVESYCSLIRRGTSAEDFNRFCAEKNPVARLNIIKKLKPHIDIMQLVERNCGKNTQTAIHLKNEGNTEFKLGKWEEAVNLYNKSLLYMPANQQTDLAALYGNRSAALFNMKEFRLTILDVERAEPYFAKENLFRILIRKSKALVEIQDFGNALMTCIQAQQNILMNNKITQAQKMPLLQDLGLMVKFLRRNSMDFCKFETRVLEAKNIEQLYLCDSMNIASNKVEGRYAISNQVIEAGTLILREEPYAAVLSGVHRELRCQECFKLIKLTPLFCDSCTDVRYCSEECKESATYHKFECGFGETLGKCKQSMAFHLALRIMTVNDISYYLSLKDKDQKDTTTLHPSGGYAAILALVTHESDFSPNKLFEFTYVAKFLTHILEQTGYFDNIASDETSYIGSLILHNILVMHYNAHEIYEMEKVIGERNGKTYTIGGAIYPTLALFNHSCAPNTARFYEGKTVNIKTTTSITNGEQINENYGPIFTQEPRNERQLVLKEKYNFECGCFACTNDWPMLKNNKNDDKLILKCQASECKGIVTIIKSMVNIEILCPQCKAPILLEDALKEITAADALMKDGVEFIEGGKIENALERFLAAITKMNIFIGPPHSKISFCQKNLRTCYAEYGNIVIHEPIAAVTTTDTNYFM